jgi:hypothetical protein
MKNFMPAKEASAPDRKKEQVIILARELFKIRISSSREGFAQDDGVHKMKVKGITSYDDQAIKKWYTEALETAEIIIALEEEYLNNENYKHFTDSNERSHPPAGGV